MLSVVERRELLRDMSEAEMQLNAILQFIGHAASQGTYGKGRKRRRSQPRELTEDIELE